jgi:hypothetical protein
MEFNTTAAVPEAYLPVDSVKLVFVFAAVKGYQAVIPLRSGLKGNVKAFGAEVEIVMPAAHNSQPTVTVFTGNRLQLGWMQIVAQIPSIMIRKVEAEDPGGAVVV